ncbi:hypothetical protein IFM89_000958 [Coptis chinensis]|uniref:Uncharacterized protein n=1 Tax=Coptis chinensis TaxID=261450 RepID=A0A835M3J1_9MAGN|nr:hypothetical protein IFM89_000958 [Coptis chinensis]
MDNLPIRGLKRITLRHPTNQIPPQNETCHAKPGHEVAKSYLNSIVQVEFDKTNNGMSSFPTLTTTLPGAAAMKEGSAVTGGIQSQSQEGVGMLSSLPSGSIPLNNKESKYRPSNSKHVEEDKDHIQSYKHDDKINSTLSKSQGKDDLQATSQEVKAEVYEPVIPSAPKKSVSIKDSTEDVNISKKKKNASKEKLKQVIEAAKVPRPLKPILRSASNINEMSDEFIRRRKEALRSSSNIDTRSHF